MSESLCRVIERAKRSSTDTTEYDYLLRLSFSVFLSDTIFRVTELVGRSASPFQLYCLVLKSASHSFIEVESINVAQES